MSLAVTGICHEWAKDGKVALDTSAILLDTFTIPKGCTCNCPGFPLGDSLIFTALKGASPLAIEFLPRV